MNAALTVAEVAGLLGQSPSAVYEAVRRGTFTNVGVGRAVRIPRREVEQRLGPVHVRRPPRVIAEGTFT